MEWLGNTRYSSLTSILPWRTTWVKNGRRILGLDEGCKEEWVHQAGSGHGVALLTDSSCTLEIVGKVWALGFSLGQDWCILASAFPWTLKWVTVWIRAVHNLYNHLWPFSENFQRRTLTKQLGSRIALGNKTGSRNQAEKIMVLNFEYKTWDADVYLAGLV